MEFPRFGFVCLFFFFFFFAFFVFENLLLLPRGFWRSPGGIPSVCFCVLGFFVLDFFAVAGGFWRSSGGNPSAWFCAPGFSSLKFFCCCRGVFGGPLVEFPLCGLCPPRRGFVCVNRPGTRTLSRGTQHFTGTVSNEATSEVGYPAWPAGRTCLSFFFLTVFLSCSLLLPGFCSAL